MVIVVRLAPLPLRSRREARLAELKRLFSTDVHLIEVVSVDELISAVATSDVTAVALDAPAPGQLDRAVAAAGSRPILRPLWRPQRDNRGEIVDVFDGYGVRTDDGIATLLDGELS